MVSPRTSASGHADMEFMTADRKESMFYRMSIVPEGAIAIPAVTGMLDSRAV